MADFLEEEEKEEDGNEQAGSSASFGANGNTAEYQHSSGDSSGGAIWQWLWMIRTPIRYMHPPWRASGCRQTYHPTTLLVNLRYRVYFRSRYVMATPFDRSSTLGPEEMLRGHSP